MSSLEIRRVCHTFHQYLYSQKFTLVTDHKPLTAILGPKKSIQQLVPAHLQR